MDENARIEQRVEEILGDAGRTGIRVDLDRLHVLQGELNIKLTQLQSEADRLVGRHIRLSSREDVAVVLFDTMHLPETYKRSVSKEALRHYEHPFINVFQEWTTARRNLSVACKLEDAVCDGRVTTTWKTRNDKSGRIYCTDFNVQSTSLYIRTALVPDAGQIYIMLDKKQFELRVLAALSGCKELCAALDSGDPHKSVSAAFLGKDVQEVTADERKMGKVFNFGLAFGMTAGGLAQKLGVSEDIAEVFINRFFASMPGVKTFLDRTARSAQRSHRLENAFGQVRTVFSFDDPARFAREAMCTIVQGTAASLLKRALVHLGDLAFVKVVATVHDSVLMSIPAELVSSLKAEVCKAYDQVFMGVQFPSEVGVGASWGAAQANMGQLDITDEE